MLQEYTAGTHAPMRPKLLHMTSLSCANPYSTNTSRRASKVCHTTSCTNQDADCNKDNQLPKANGDICQLIRPTVDVDPSGTQVTRLSLCLTPIPVRTCVQVRLTLCEGVSCGPFSCLSISGAVNLGECLGNYMGVASDQATFEGVLNLGCGASACRRTSPCMYQRAALLIMTICSIPARSVLQKKKS